MPTTRISILTPTFNHEKFIETCIISVLKQTYQDWEMIIIDDGSTDNTGGIISKFKDSRIKYYQQSHNGPWRLAQTYNSALLKSSGKYIAILEGDDFWPEDKLETQFVTMENNPNAVISYGEAMMVSELGDRLNYIYLPDDESITMNFPVGSSLKGFFDTKLFIPAITLLFRREPLERIGGFQYSPWVPTTDYPTLLRLCLEGIFLPIRNKCMGYWRRHSKSISVKYRLEGWKGMIKHNYWYIKTYQNELKKLGLLIDKKEIKINFRKNLTFELGLLNLERGKFKLARAMLFKHLKNKPKHKEKYIIYLGLFSSFIRVDLFTKLKKIRNLFNHR